MLGVMLMMRVIVVSWDITAIGIAITINIITIVTVSLPLLLLLWSLILLACNWSSLLLLLMIIVLLMLRLWWWGCTRSWWRLLLLIAVVVGNIRSKWISINIIPIESSCLIRHLENWALNGCFRCLKYRCIQLVSRLNISCCCGTCWLYCCIPCRCSCSWLQRTKFLFQYQQFFFQWRELLVILRLIDT